MSDSIARGKTKKSLPPALKQVQQLLAKGLKATAARLPATAERLVHVQQYEETRRQQFRFRKNPLVYLAALEAQLLT